MRRTATQLLILAVVLTGAACNDNATLPAIRLQGLTMGTAFSITLIDPPANLELSALQSRIENELERIETIASSYRPDSELSKLNNNPSEHWIPISDELCEMLATTQRIGGQTDGAFDLTVGSLVDLWGFGAPQRDTTPPNQAEIDSALRSVGYQILDVDCDQPAVRKAGMNVRIDLAGWAKGYAVDRVAQFLESSGIRNFLVEIGGEIRVRGHNAESRRFAIGIEAPIAESTVIQTALRVTDSGIATSGDYRNFFTHDGIRYSHTIDPRTGRPIRHDLASVTVLSETAAAADALATALLVMGSDAGMTFANDRGIAAYFVSVTPDGPQDARSRALLELDK